jgi:hypothetical protein
MIKVHPSASFNQHCFMPSGYLLNQLAIDAHARQEVADLKRQSLRGSE